jgi:NADH-quinone oxidoreductase subunit L
MEGLILGLPLSLVAGLVPALPLLGALLNGGLALLVRSGRRAVPEPLVSVIGLLFPVASFLLSLFLCSLTRDPAQGILTDSLWSWMRVGELVVPVAFKIDRLSLTMTLVVTGVGSLIHLYSVGYMAGDRGFARYFSYLNLFLFSMLLLVLAGNLPLLFVGWEGVGLCSYLLIGFWFGDREKAYAGQKAFVVNRIGDLGFLLGMFLIFATLHRRGVSSPLGLLTFDVMSQYRGELFPVATVASLLLFLGAIGKSAQLPLYVWLPDAMAGPTPVSALIHAATMVTAGVYMIARMHFLFTLSPLAMEIVASVGVGTAFFGALVALAQRDIKKVLAFSTVSQLGFMIASVGVGAFSAGIFHLVTHAFFKACLFLGAGSVIHALGGEQDIWKMGGLRKGMPITFVSFFVAGLAVIGIFPFAGFFSKDAILFQTFATGHRLLWGLSLVTSGLTAFYICRLMTVVFLGPSRVDPEKRYHESPPSMTIPLLLLGLLSLIGGWIGIPVALHGKDLFFNWHAPLFPYSYFYEQLERAGHGLELLLSIVTFLWVFHIGFLTIILYSQRPQTIAKIARKLRGIATTLENQFYMNELYNLIVVRPLTWVSREVFWHFQDEKVIDRLMVHGSADTVSLVGRTFALLQTGFVQHYALFFIIGGMGLIFYLIL